MKNLITRSITGLVFVSVLIGSILFGQWSFAVLFLLISLAGNLEFYKLIEKSVYKTQKIAGSIIGVFLFVALFFIEKGQLKAEFLLILLPLSLLIFVIELYRKHSHPFSNIAITLLGPAYIFLPFALFSGLVFFNENTNYNPDILLGLFILIWIYDSGAYIFGVSFGKHRLFERISPKKSWEGLIGGVVSALLVAWLISGWLVTITLTDWFAITIIVIVAGTYGDLAESMLKRSLGVKDSGNILPGHGGILDRFDAVLLASPLVFTYLELIY